MLTFPFLPRREQVLVVEVAKEHSSAVLFGVSPDRAIALDAFWERFDLRRLPRLVRRVDVVAAADASLATTISFPLTLVREAPKEPLAVTELENLLAQAVARVWDECRRRAAAELGIAELDAAVVGSKARGFSMDGHRVHDPVGCTGRRVRAVLDLTLSTRELFESFHALFQNPKHFFFTEAARAEMSCLERALRAPANLVVVGFDRSVAFPATHGGGGKGRRRIAWGIDTLLRGIMKEFGVSRPVAYELYLKHTGHALSPHLERSIGKAVAAEAEKFAGKMKPLGLRGRVFLESIAPLPPEFPAHAGRISFAPVTLGFLSEKFGFTIEGSPLLEQVPWLVRYLAPFFESYYEAAELPINQKLRRRLHWLSAD